MKKKANVPIGFELGENIQTKPKLSKGKRAQFGAANGRFQPNVI
jgi:Cu/Zn superoxide dismutase